MSSLTLQARLASFALLLLAACGGGGAASIPAGAPTISSFVATPAATNAGRQATLSWLVSDATQLVLQPGAIDVTGRSSYALTAVATTSYTLEATNKAGTSRALAKARVYDWTQTGNVLDSFVGAVGSNSITGYSFVIVDKIGALYQRSGGDQSNSTVSPIASACKAPAAAAILTLVDSGKLALDTPVQQYLALDPGFIWPPDKAAITMRMLLAHTSGIVGLSGNQPSCQGQQTGISLRDCAQQIANSNLVNSPGTAFNYGGSDYQLAGYIATLLSRRSWQDFFASAITTPLAMPSFRYANVSNPTIAGGAVSNVGDYARFVQMIQNQGTANGMRVLSGQMTAELKKNQIEGLPVTYAPFPPGRQGFYPGYGFGEFISESSQHPGSAGPEFSDPGLFGAVPWFDDSLGYGAMLLITKNTATGLNIWDAVRPAIIQQYNGN